MHSSIGLELQIPFVFLFGCFKVVYVCLFLKCVFIMVWSIWTFKDISCFNIVTVKLSYTMSTYEDVYVIVKTLVVFCDLINAHQEKENGS